MICFCSRMYTASTKQVQSTFCGRGRVPYRPRFHPVQPSRAVRSLGAAASVA